ncbi:hypothetical protein QBC42DRAFT_223056 [Cladorrhinum samala]|uniref:RecQ mediated genome instability protein 1-like N-terminal helical domain-containing protein n=1 Tax=Cladorrhinum samala TaxID=585594 RepID=A0AAV9HR11_9PEZI|nr:hypothetical protein QBC42DRAFT_223056 [Cladorrhinum samala]
MPPPPARSSLPQQLHSALQTATIPLPSLPWLTTLSSSRNPPPPLASLLATARARILAADLTTPSLLDPTYASTHCFPPNLSNPQTPSCSLPADIIIQVLDVENLSKSRWEQVEELESMARGETKRGREIIRIQDQDAEGEDGGVDQVDRGQATQSSAQFTSQASSSGAAATQQRQVQGRQQHQQQQQQQAHESNKNATHKLLMQDCKGQKVYGIELKRVERIGVGPSSTLIGQKILLKRGAEVSRGVVMLEPSKTVVLGGKVEVWNKAWNEGRLERLKGAAERGGEPA